MADSSKTKKELIDELKILRAELLELKSPKGKGLANHETKEYLEFEMILNTLNDGAILAHPESDGFFFANNKFCRMFGYTPDEIKTLGIGDIHPLEDLPFVIEQFENLRLGKLSIAKDIPVMRKDRSVFYADISSSEIEFHGNIYMLGLFRDRTELIESKKSFNDSQHRYKGLFENMIDGAAYHEIVLDKDNNPIDYIFLEVNSAFETHTGLKREDVIGRRVTEVIPGIDKAEPDLISIYGRVATTGEKTAFDLFFEPFNRWYCVSAYSPEKGFFVSIFENITARKKLERELIIDKAKLEDKVKERTSELAQANDCLIAENIERKRNEEALSLAQEFAMMGNWVHNLQSDELSWSEQTFRLFGLKPYEIMPTYEAYLSFVHSNDKKLVSNSGKMSYRSKKPYDIEFRVIKKDGEERVFHSKAKIINDKEGNPLMRVGVNQDITERKHSEDALKEAKETYESMFLNSMVGMSRTRLSDGKFLEINDRLVEMFGYDDREDFVANYSAVKCYAIAGERERVLSIIKEFGKINNVETLARRKDGSTFWVQYSGRVNKSGSYLDSVSLDVTKRKEADEKLKSERRRLFSILDSFPGFVYLQAPDYSIRFANKRFIDHYGDPTGKTCHELIWDRDVPCERCPAFEVFETKKPVEWISDHKSTESSYQVYDYPFIDTDGTLLVLELSIDITERKKTSKRIEALNRCFLDFGTDSTQNILNLTHLLGSLMKGRCALYNRIEKGMLITVCNWNTPPDYNPKVKPEGHICYDVIRNENNDILYIGDLTQTEYAKTDINVINYNLVSYLGKTVTCNGKHIGSLCVVFTDKFVPSEEDNKYLEIIAVAIGIEEERKLAGEKLARVRENSRSLSMHLQNMQEQERSRIARDIHDDLGQLLTALDFDLAYVNKRLHTDQKELLEKTRKMSDLIRISAETVQRIASELRPALLDNLGLIAAMEWQADEYSAHTGIKCEVECASSIVINNKNLSTALFRAFQEGLTNAARHANPSKVLVRVKESAGCLTLEITDDGKGISDKDVTDSNSFGLTGIMERFYPFGGKVKIKGVKNKGTVVSITVPLGEKK